MTPHATNSNRAMTEHFIDHALASVSERLLRPGDFRAIFREFAGISAGAVFQPQHRAIRTHDSPAAPLAGPLL